MRYLVHVVWLSGSRWMCDSAHIQRFLKSIAFSLVFLVVSGCKSATDGGGRAISEAFIAGKVLTSVGQGVAGATIAAFTYGGACGPPGQAHSFSQAATNTAGEYTIQVGSPSIRGEVCVAVRITPMAGSGLRDSTITGLHPILRFPGLGVPIDTLRVDVVLSQVSPFAWSMR